MSVACCLDHALRIGQLPPEQWRSEVEKLPIGCERSECTGVRCCRTRTRQFLEDQWKLRQLATSPTSKVSSVGRYGRR